MKRFVIKDYAYDNSNNEEIIMRIEPESSLNDVLNAFERFLKACGYYFDGRLEIVNETNNEDDGEVDDELWVEARKKNEAQE